MTCWQPADDNHCGLGGAYGEHQITGGIPIHPGTIAVGGVCLDDGPDGPWWHCRSNVNPLRSTFDDCCPAPGGPNYCQILYPVGINDPDPNRLPMLSVVAPMADIFGTSGDGIVEQSNNGFAMTADGTSFVAPQIAGIIGLMLRVNPDLSLWEVRHILEVTATDLTVRTGQNTFDYVGYDRFTGHGLVNARKHSLPADWNGDGHIETLDAAFYLIDYTNADAMTDLNLDTIQTTDDVAIFLDSYAGE
ncbi:MAG: S8 family serine peptidase [Phycisphaerales bacterium]|nr:S8 family serine peptidase [Phycisphaerales bacterium]